MISLILTLFISLLSLGSPIYRLEENSESRISIISNESLNLSESKPIQHFYNAERYVFLGSSEFGTYEYYRHFLANLENYQYFYNTTYTIQQFLNGETIFVRPPNNEAFLFGTLNQGSFVTWDYVTGMNFALNRSDDYKDIMSYKFYWDSDNRWIEIKATYIYSDASKAYCVANLVTYNLNNFADPAEYVYRYDTSSTLKSILPYDFSTFTYTQGYEDGSRDGYINGEKVGYQEGLFDGLNNYDYDSTALTIFSGIMGIALVPINMFLQIFNFEILGINLSGFISGILTIAVVVIVIRVITGGKKDD